MAFWKQAVKSLVSLKNSLQRLIQPNKAVSGGEGSNNTQAAKMRKRVAWQAGLAGLTVVLTVVIVFAMTAAWYTNIVHTDGLTFEAAAWGFKGTIKVNEEAIQAGPGDEGNIHLEVANESDNIAAVSVNVSKAQMAEEMQKRLYFYVDTQVTRNEETMNRVYLNSQENYTYTLFSNTPLTLTDAVHNDAQLKWHWVYDVLGYYVLGTRDEEGNLSGVEYLRPIEYDYDAATTTFKTDEDGNITAEIGTVDGTVSVEDFLVEVSKTDGYPGQIEPEKKLETGYYPVSVDEETGYGVYAYLCNYGEIAAATQWDTALGRAAAEGEQTGAYIAKLTIAAQKGKNSVYTAASLADLTAAMTLENAEVIQLGGDITIPADTPLVLPEGKQIMLDLNEHTIITESAQSAIVLQEGSAVTLANGTLRAVSDDSGYAISSTGAEVTLSNIKLENYYRSIHVADNAGTKGMDSKIRIVNSQIYGKDCVMLVRGNGTASAGLTQIIVQGSTLESDDIVICGNGNLGNGTAASSGQYGTDIQILNSNIISNANNRASGIYHPQKESYLTVYNSTVSGYTGIAAKGGHVKIVNSVIEGRGAVSYEPFFDGSGYSDTADAVYIETNYPYTVSLEIYQEEITEENGLLGTKLTSTNGRSLRVFEENATNMSVKIYGGIFDEEQPEKFLAADAVQVQKDDYFYEIGIPPKKESEEP